MVIVPAPSSRGRARRVVPFAFGAAMGLATLSQAFASPPPRFAVADEAPPPAPGGPAEVDMVRVPAGSYPIGRDDGPADERPVHTVALEAFRIDRTEVTNAAFAAFLNALSLDVRGSAPAGRLDATNEAEGQSLLREGRERSGVYPIIALDDAQARIDLIDGRFVPSSGFADHPVTETTWAGAAAFCRWRGGRLPTEVEWEAAARGTDGRLYPWGDDAPTTRLVAVGGGTGDTVPVGSRPDGASPFGALDMAGSLAEWTSSLKRPYPYDASDGREDVTVPGERVTRGGDYIYDRGRSELTATHRDGFSNAPDRGHRHIGFRCAADG